MKVWVCTDNEDKHYTFYINDTYWKIIVSQQDIQYCLILDYTDCYIKIDNNKIKIPRIKLSEAYHYLTKYNKLLLFS
jgi:hypothetical protein